MALLAIALQAEKKELSSSCFSALLSVKGSLIKFCAAAEKCYCFPRNMDCLLRSVIVKLSFLRYGNVWLDIWYQVLNLESKLEVEPICCKKRQKIVSDQLLVWGVGDL